MSQLPSVTTVSKNNYLIHADFIKECIEYSVHSTVKYTNGPTDYSPESFFNWSQADELYLLNRNSKFIGIVVLHTTELDGDSLVTFTTFLHPRVCKMAAISLLKGALCLSSIYSLTIQANSLSTYIYHNILVATIRQVFPTARSMKLTTLCQFCSVSLEGIERAALVEKLRSLFDDEVDDYLALF